jgi:nucleoside-diphosphate-sugar epimerase
MNFVPNATHDFIDVEDVVEAIINLSSVSARGIFEVGWGVTYTNQEVLALVEKVIKKRANVTYVDSMRPYDNFQWRTTNYKARSWGWLPKVTLEDTIKKMVKAYEN